MTAFMLSATVRFMIAINSACCSHALKPGREGQSMFETVATHTARNSRTTSGGSDCPEAGDVRRTHREMVAIARFMALAER